MRKEVELELKRAVEQYKKALLELSEEEIFEIAHNEYDHWEDVVELMENGLFTKEEMHEKLILILIYNKVESVLKD